MTTTLAPSAVASSAIIVEPGDGPAYWGVGEHFVSKITAERSNGAFVLAELTVVPGGGPPPHLHRREDEFFYVLEGEMDFLVGDKIVPASAGSFLWAPRDTVHQFRAKNAPARFLIGVTPGHLEKMFLAFLTSVKPGETEAPPMDPSLPGRIVRVASEQFGIEFAFGADATDRTTPALRRSLWVLGSHVTFLADGNATNGQLCIVQVMTPPGEGPPPHYHREQSETLYFLEGTFELTLGDRTVTARPGTTAYVPAGVVHAFRNAGSSPGRFLSIHHTAGMEHFFQECGVQGSSEHPPQVAPPDRHSLLAIFRKHGMDVPGAK